MTLLSRPVLGASQCLSTSAWASIASSQQKSSLCSGHPPEYWVLPLNFPSWPAGYFADTVPDPNGHTPTLFMTWLYLPSTYLPTTTLIDVLGFAVGQDDVARYIVAALLNATAGLAPPLFPITIVQGIWSEYASTGGGAGGRGSSGFGGRTACPTKGCLAARGDTDRNQAGSAGTGSRTERGFAGRTPRAA